MIVLAADLGGTTVKLGLVQGEKLLAFDRIPAQADQPMSGCLERIGARWEAMLSAAGSKWEDCVAAALAVPFVVAPDNKSVLGDFGKFPGAEQVDFSAWGRTRLAGLPVLLENDLRMALLGEAEAGAAKGCDSAVMLALGTGIGCAVLSGGHLLRGARNRAGTLMGHCSVAFDGLVGRCGNPGCAEDQASTAVLADLARRRPDFSGSRLSQAQSLDYETLFRCADEGDDCSRSLLEHSLRIWASLLLTTVLAYDPEIVIVGGGVMRRQEFVLPVFRAHLNRHLPAIRADIQVVAGKLGDQAALLGCERFAAATRPGVLA